MNPPKTLHLTNFYHAHSGGIGAFYRALFDHANRVGREMRLVVPGDQDGCDDVGNCGRIYTIASPRSPWIDGRYRLLLPLGRSGRRIAEILRAEAPDTLEVSDKYSMPYVAGMLRKGLISGAKRPIEIATSHERLTDNVSVHLNSGLPGAAFARWYLRWIYYAQFDHHIANSPYTAEELLPASLGHRTRRGIWICPMGVDTSLFAPGCDRAINGRRLLYTGRLAREKNVALLLDGLELLPAEYTLDVIGDGPQRDWFAREASRRLPGRVRMHGFVADRLQYIESLRQADVFVHPNPHEPFGIGPLEAMACGVPVVVPNSGGVLSYANRENAVLYQPSAEGLAQAVASVFDDPAGTRESVRQARQTAEQHDWHIVSRRFFDLLDTLHDNGWAADGLLRSPTDAACRLADLRSSEE